MALLIGLPYFAISLLSGPADKWVALKESFVTVSTEHNAVIVLKEVVYKSLNSGFLEKAEEEGKRVKKGQIIASLVTTMDAADEARSKEEVKPEPDQEEELNAQEQTEDEAEAESEKKPADGAKEEKSETPVHKDGIRADALSTFQALNEALKARDTASALKLKRELQYKLNTLEKSENNPGLSVVENERYIGSASAKQGEKFSVICSEPGQLSYYIDEYSGKLHMEQYYDFDYDRLFNEDIVGKNMRKAEFKRSDPVFKVISPTKWHIICELGMDDMESFSTQEKLSVILNGRELKGEVQDEFVINNRALVLIEMREPINFTEDGRRTRVTIVHDKIAAVVIPFEALTSEGREQGVYVKGINGEKVFRPVDIKHSNEEGYVVTSGSYTVKHEDGSFKTVDTVTSMDEVLVKHSK